MCFICVYVCAPMCSFILKKYFLKKSVMCICINVFQGVSRGHKVSEALAGAGFTRV